MQIDSRLVQCSLGDVNRRGVAQWHARPSFSIDGIDVLRIHVPFTDSEESKENLE